ncbi:hypothetical protein SAMN04487819_116134 [Actinopolyspora alba]|uniref:Uncharacterized protein n=1 Tax=Actinopolyspora alba TaxID=673379 RepID=A0A1I2BK07_9ACTN|nr:hypothetical protein SAMN04487819_116134 [Actinopolyspora alba]
MPVKGSGGDKLEAGERCERAATVVRDIPGGRRRFGMLYRFNRERFPSRRPISLLPRGRRRSTAVVRVRQEAVRGKARAKHGVSSGVVRGASATGGAPVSGVGRDVAGHAASRGDAVLASPGSGWREIEFLTGSFVVVNRVEVCREQELCHRCVRRAVVPPSRRKGAGHPNVRSADSGAWSRDR